MKIIIIPDLHIGSRSFGKDFPDKLNSRVQDKFQLMEFVFEEAKRNNVDKMVFLGDVFEKEEPEPILISTFFKWLTKCTDFFSVDIIMGNHDYKRIGEKRISILDTIPAARIKNCKIFNKIETITYDDLSVTYVPFFDKKQFSFETNKEATNFVVGEIKNSIKSGKGKKHISVGHLAIEKSIYVGDEISDEHNELFIPVSTFKNCDHAWFGHIHNPQILSRDPFVAHLGSLDKKSFSEGDKFVCIYDSDKNAYKDIKLPCRNLVDIKISIPKDVKNTNEYIKNEIEKYNEDQFNNSIVRISIDTFTNDAETINKKEINKLLAGLNVQHVAEIVEKKQVGAIEIKTQIDEQMSPNKAVDLFMETIEAKEEFKKEVSSVCKEIIKEILGA